MTTDERKKYEAHISELEKKLAEQTQKQFRASEELEQFVYAASHDLQEPLRMIASYVQLMQRQIERGDTKNLSDFMNFVVDSSTRMQSLVNDLLQFSRVNRKGNAFAEADVNEIMQRATVHLFNKIKVSEAKITVEKLPVVRCDANQLLRLFINLIDNAIKFKFANRKPEIKISVKENDLEYVFTVSDNGMGIEKKFYERIFIIFQRLHPRAEYEGTGVGLAVCKKIAERHEGKIWVESEVDKGSSFYFTIKKAI